MNSVDNIGRTPPVKLVTDGPITRPMRASIGTGIQKSNAVRNVRRLVEYRHSTAARCNRGSSNDRTGAAGITDHLERSGRGANGRL